MIWMSNYIEFQVRVAESTLYERLLTILTRTINYESLKPVNDMGQRRVGGFRIG